MGFPHFHNLSPRDHTQARTQRHRQRGQHMGHHQLQAEAPEGDLRGQAAQGHVRPRVQDLALLAQQLRVEEGEPGQLHSVQAGGGAVKSQWQVISGHSDQVQGGPWPALAVNSNLGPHFE